jgi:hypothetical protein
MITKCRTQRPSQPKKKKDPAEYKDEDSSPFGSESSDSEDGSSYSGQGGNKRKRDSKLEKK